MGAEGLTGRQLDVLAFVAGFFGRHQRYPTIREVMGEFGFASPNGVAAHLKALAAKGALAADGAGHYRVPELDAAVRAAADECLKRMAAPDSEGV